MSTLNIGSALGALGGALDERINIEAQSWLDKLLGKVSGDRPATPVSPTIQAPATPATTLQGATGNGGTPAWVWPAVAAVSVLVVGGIVWKAVGD